MWIVIVAFIIMLLIFISITSSNNKRCESEQISNSVVDKNPDEPWRFCRRFFLDDIQIGDDYYVYKCNVSGTFYLDDLGKEHVKNLAVGDNLGVSHEKQNPVSTHAMVLYDKTNVKVGYIPDDLSFWLCDKSYKIVSVKVDYLSKFELPHIVVALYFKQEADAGFIRDSCNMNEREYPILKIADKIAQYKPDEALLIYEDIADLESGIYAKHKCLQIYRKLGDPFREEEMIGRILNICEVSGRQEEIKVYESRLQWVKTLQDRYFKKMDNIIKKRQKNNF